MNILPKKRWHVRTKQNIERVRRDEAKAADEEKELKRRIQLAEQEARIELLRKRAKSSSDVCSKSQHTDYMPQIEGDNGYYGGVNKEHEAEERARKEKFEKDIGLLTYLGQSSVEAKGEVPWYLKSGTKDIITGSDGKDEVASSKHKSFIDPLNDIKKFVSLKEKKHAGKIFKPSYEKDKPKQQQKDKKNSSKTMSKVEELRAKRLKRETEERRRSQQFLESLRKGPPVNEEVIMDDRLRQYNSQFNPHLARKNQLPNKDVDRSL